MQTSGSRRVPPWYAKAFSPRSLWNPGYFARFEKCKAASQRQPTQQSSTRKADTP